MYISWNLQLKFDIGEKISYNILINKKLIFEIWKKASAIRNDQLLHQFNGDIWDKKKFGYHKKCYQEYTNKQKLKRITTKQNEEGYLLRRSSRSAGIMGKKNMSVKVSSDSIKLNGVERQKITKIPFISLLYFGVIRQIKFEVHFH